MKKTSNGLKTFRRNKRVPTESEGSSNRAEYSMVMDVKLQEDIWRGNAFCAEGTTERRELTH